MRTSNGLTARQKRLLFRAWHRGTREMDLILGAFVDAQLADLDDDQMNQLEQLMDVADPELFKWITGEAEVPSAHNNAIYQTLVNWHRTNNNSQRPSDS